jgi:NADH:ubiquinone oxidoreductase subunit 5 (subunit L)/multisubunit Na+/H+ antiporter MnhA subunit
MFRLLFIAFLGEYRGGVNPAELGIRHPASTGAPPGEQVPGHAHAPAWIMNVPVAILVVPSVAIGAALMFGGDASPWARFFAPLFAPQALPAAAISETLTSAIVFALVIVGFAVAWSRYATRAAQANAVARLREESVRMPAVLTNLFYVDVVIDAIFVRSSQLLGTVFGRLLDPHVLDGAVRDTAFWADWFGALVRSFETGLVRAYALLLVFGAACFIAYYALAGVVR